MASTAFAAAKFLPATHLDSSPRLSPLRPAPTELLKPPKTPTKASKIPRPHGPSHRPQNHRRLPNPPFQAPPPQQLHARRPLSSSASSLSSEQRRRADTNLALARARRNLHLAQSKASGGAVKLEELLVEETWLEALPGELHKPYALKLCRFVTHERLHGKVPVYPPPHLAFHALHTTPFDRVKAVIIGQEVSGELIPDAVVPPGYLDIPRIK